MDLAIGFALGFWALPWMWMSVVMLLCVVDVVLCENEAFSWGTGMLIGGVATVAWLGGDVNVFSWAWGNIAEILQFLLVYFAVGSLWSIVKWYFYLIEMRDEASKWADDDSPPKRPYHSYASQNVDRLMGWVGHWPFSMIGSLFGDVLKKVVESIYHMLKGLYDTIGNSVFKGFKE